MHAYYDYGYHHLPKSVFGLRISNTSIEILLFLKFCVWIKIIVKVKENECKEKKRYDWCTSKKKNTDKKSHKNRDTTSYTITTFNQQRL